MKSRQSIAAALGLTLLLSLTTFGTSAHASCLPPVLSLTPAENVENLAKNGVSWATINSVPRIGSAAAGQKVGLVGVGFYQACRDVGINGVLPPMEPVKRVGIFFMQGSRRVQIDTVDANKDLAFVIAFSVPADAVAGPAELIAEWFPDELGRAGSTSVPLTVIR